LIADENDERLFFMTKESKNILTRESCQKELVRWAKGEMIPDVVLLMVMLLIFVPLFVACVYVAKNILVLGIILSFEDVLQRKVLHNDHRCNLPGKRSFSAFWPYTVFCGLYGRKQYYHRRKNP
jgi:hypothetical protein